MAQILQDFSVAGDYSYDDSTIEFFEGKARLKQLSTWSGLKAHWRLNEDSYNGTDGEVKDSKGANHGRADIVQINSDGKLNNCGLFGGADNEEIEIPASQDFKYENGCTWGFWVKPTGTQNFMAMAQDYTDVYFETTDGGENYTIRWETGYGSSITTIDTIPKNQWSFVVVTCTTSGDANIYINGELSLNGSISSVADRSGNSMHIGTFNGWDYRLVGKLDNIFVFNRDLSLSEIAFLYNSGTGRELFEYQPSQSIYKTNGDSVADVTQYTSFGVVEGGVGSLGFQLSNDGVNWKYWDGLMWTDASNTNYNTEATINDNISTFPTTIEKIYVRVFFVTDGTQSSEIDTLTVDYVDNTNPIVDAGANRVFYVDNELAIFSGASVSDPDGELVKAEYRIIGTQESWIEILQGGYSTLQEAIRSLKYTFSSTGRFNPELKVTDNGGGATIGANTIDIIPKDERSLSDKDLELIQDSIIIPEQQPVGSSGGGVISGSIKVKSEITKDQIANIASATFAEINRKGVKVDEHTAKAIKNTEKEIKKVAKQKDITTIKRSIAKSVSASDISGIKFYTQLTNMMIKRLFGRISTSDDNTITPEEFSELSFTEQQKYLKTLANKRRN